MVKESTPPVQSRSLRRHALTRLLVILGSIVFINIIASVYYMRLDLTEDQRFTIQEPTHDLLDSLNDIVFVKVYLAGEDLPPEFRKLREATQDMLEEFRRIGGSQYVQYQFIDPDNLPDAKARQSLYEELGSKGLSPMRVQVSGDAEFQQKIIIPGALMTYRGKTVPIALIDQQMAGLSPEDQLHYSTVGLEYKLADGLRRAAIEDKPKIAFIQGHGELNPLQVAGAAQALDPYYGIDFVDLPRYKVGRLDPYAAVIVAKPDSTFDDLEKYKLDQYVMNGGKVLWFVESLNINEDTLRNSAFTITTDYDLKLAEELFFRYGIRINYNLVMDINAHTIGLVQPGYGQQLQRVLLRYPFYPLVTPQSDHPVVNNLNPIWFQYANTIEVLNNEATREVKKTVLLKTSSASRILPHPARVGFFAATRLNEERPLYNAGEQTLGVLLEGSFESAYKNRLTPEAQENGKFGKFKDKSVPTKMLFVSDGDVIANAVGVNGQTYQPGFDPRTGAQFGNKTFILNAVDYMVAESGLIQLRSKDYQLRLLDKDKVKQEKVNWQLLNILLPLALLMIFGIAFNYIRKRRYAA